MWDISPVGLVHTVSLCSLLPQLPYFLPTSSFCGKKLLAIEATASPSTTTSISNMGVISRSRQAGHVGSVVRADEPKIEHEEDAAEAPRFDPEQVKRALRTIDLRLLPVLTLLYLLAFIDRGNIGNAKIAGMNEDLGLSQTQYNIALTVFHPSSHALDRVRRLCRC